MYLQLLTPKRILTISFINDVFISSLKWNVGHTCNSAALIADAKHSISDVIVDIGALSVVDKSVTIQKVFTSFVSLSLLFLAYDLIKDVFCVKHVICKSNTYLIYIVQSIVILSKELLYRMMSHLSRTYNSATLLATSQHQRSDVFTSLTSTGGAILQSCGFMIADKIATIFIALLIAKTSVELYSSS